MEINLCPRWLLTKLGLAPDQQIHFALLFSAVAAIALAPLVVHIPHFCVVQALLRIPCPGCGILHSLTALLRLDVHRAWQSNPAGFAVAALLAFQLVARPAAICGTGARAWVVVGSRVGSNLVVASLLLSWTFRLLQGRI